MWGNDQTINGEGWGGKTEKKEAEGEERESGN